jgi:hypothetical protein
MAAHSTAWCLFAAMRGQGFGIEDGQATSAADGAALVMLGAIFFVTGLIAVFAWTMCRRSRRPDPTLEFLARLREEQKPGGGEEASGTREGGEGWERPPDWWKKDS